jgi:hypothetical protein
MVPLPVLCQLFNMIYKCMYTFVVVLEAFKFLSTFFIIYFLLIALVSTCNNMVRLPVLCQLFNMICKCKCTIRFRSGAGSF